MTRSSSAAPSSTDAGSRLLPTLVDILGLVLSVVYAGWAVTGRLGIFAAFAARRYVSVEEARANDRIDTLLAAVAGFAILVALAVWLAQRFSSAASASLLDSLGLALTCIGVVVAVVGLSLAGRLGDEVDQIAAGTSGVTASLVTAMGYGMAALGLILGLLALRRPSNQLPPTVPPTADSAPAQQPW